MATDKNKGKKPAEAAPAAGKQKLPSRQQQEDTRNPDPDPYRYDVNRCYRCKITTDLEVLDSKWRGIVLCKKCLFLIESTDFCSYCFNPVLLKDNKLVVSFLTCLDCFRCIHFTCLHYQRSHVPGCPVNPDSFFCIDCRPFPNTPNLLINNPSSYNYKEEEEEKKKTSKTSTSARKSRKLEAAEKINVAEGSSSAGRSSVKPGKIIPNVPADRVDKIDRWEWEKCEGRNTDQGSADHLNRRYYRCKNFSQGCLVEKHVEPNRNNPQTFDIMWTDDRHNHRLPGHRGSDTSKTNSSRKIGEG